MILKPRKIKRENLVLTNKQKNSKENRRRFEDLLDDLGTTKKGMVNRIWKRDYHFQLTYSRVFRKWQKDKNKRKFVKWFNKQDLYPNEVNRIVNVMWVLEKRYGYNWLREKGDNLLQDAIFLAFYLEDDIRERTQQIFKTKGYIAPKTPIHRKQAMREFIARGFVEVNDFEDYDPDYSYVVINFEKDKYYYPKKCYNSIDQMGDNIMNVHILQSLVGISGFTAVKYKKR